MLDKIVFGLLILAAAISVLFVYSFVTPNYALIHVDGAGNISPTSPLFIHGNCEEYAKSMDSFGPIDGKYACVLVTKTITK